MDPGRRAWLKVVASAPIAAAFAVTEAEAEQAHHAAAEARQAARKAGAPYRPAFFTDHEYRTVRVLVDLIIPKDERSGSATDAGVPEFMDFTMVDQPGRQTAMRGGLSWLDAESNRRFDKTFVAATDAERRQILDDVSGHGEPPPGLSHGQAFFRSFRDLTASGFWTSKMGIEDIGYIGNTLVPEWTGCPADALRKLGVTRAAE
jgi:hypothetical protein